MGEVGLTISTALLLKTRPLLPLLTTAIIQHAAFCNNLNLNRTFLVPESKSTSFTSDQEKVKSGNKLGVSMYVGIYMGYI